jgi:hypothetical protein
VDKNAFAPHRKRNVPAELVVRLIELSRQVDFDYASQGLVHPGVAFEVILARQRE